LCRKLETLKGELAEEELLVEENLTVRLLLPPSYLVSCINILQVLSRSEAAVENLLSKEISMKKQIVEGNEEIEQLKEQR